MSITFPTSPMNGDTFNWGGYTYTFDSTPGLWIGGDLEVPTLTFPFMPTYNIANGRQADGSDLILDAALNGVWLASGNAPLFSIIFPSSFAGASINGDLTIQPHAGNADPALSPAVGNTVTATGTPATAFGAETAVLYNFPNPTPTDRAANSGSEDGNFNRISFTGVDSTAYFVDRRTRGNTTGLTFADPNRDYLMTIRLA